MGRRGIEYLCGCERGGGGGFSRVAIKIAWVGVVGTCSKPPTDVRAYNTTPKDPDLSHFRYCDDMGVETSSLGLGSVYIADI